MKLKLLCLIALALQASPVLARCPDYKDVVAYVISYLNREPAKAFGSIQTIGDAQCAQGAVASELARHKGTIAGFRAGFTNKAMQQRYKVEGPLRAFLFKNMFLANASRVRADYAARPSVEAGLIAVVKDGELQEAKTPLEALAHISHFLPYIELADLSLAESEPLNKLSMLAINVGTHTGIIGEPIPVEPTEDFLRRLAQMTVVLTTNDGAELGRAGGEAVLEHPMNAVLWLAQGLERDGMRILEGDKLSLGTFVPAAAPRAGTGVTVSYRGLPGEPSVSVTFE